MSQHPEPQPEPKTAPGEGCASTSADRKPDKSATARLIAIARPLTVACSSVRLAHIGCVTVGRGRLVGLLFLFICARQLHLPCERDAPPMHCEGRLRRERRLEKLLERSHAFEGARSFPVRLPGCGAARNLGGLRPRAAEAQVRRRQAIVGLRPLAWVGLDGREVVTIPLLQSTWHEDELQRLVKHFRVQVDDRVARSTCRCRDSHDLFYAMMKPLVLAPALRRSS